MKSWWLYLLLFVSFLQGCSESDVLPEATGSNGEVLVVVSQNQWERGAGTAIRDLLEEEQQGLPQSEPLFDLIRIEPGALNNTFQRIRNVLVVNISSREQPRIEIRRNEWAEGQVVVFLHAPDEATLITAVSERGQDITDAFYQNGFSRTLRGLRQLRDQDREQELFGKHGFTLRVPSTFRLMADEDQFVWFRSSAEKREDGQVYPVEKSIWVQYEDYLDTQQLSRDSMIARRNRVTRTYVEGPLDSSYMQIMPAYPPIYRTYEINGLYVAELRGLWNMNGATMAGPFVMISLIDKNSGRLYTLDGFIFAPSTGKRDYVRELEAILTTISFGEPSR